MRAALRHLRHLCVPRARDDTPAAPRATPLPRAVCDPVLGDGGKLYVPTELVEAYRAEVVPLAAVVTPNQFEAELLTGRAVRTVDDAVRPRARAATGDHARPRCVPAPGARCC